LSSTSDTGNHGAAHEDLDDLPEVPMPTAKSGGARSWLEFPILVAVAVGLAVLIKTFLLQAFFIPSGSMETTLHGCPGCRGDRITAVTSWSSTARTTTRRTRFRPMSPATSSPG
jgi:Signal peptidase, peptidase S26